ncbi:hypothetical protein V1525DRAFT_402589 [Lipomyces kononenkoae]|uniref:Uncharacterized protein n=1 Tax=Lipomyces kononenkoae TaxID=34357 RepID=A0ACC3T233_LIPKO
MGERSFDAISVHSFLWPHKHQRIFGESESGNKWRAIIDHVCEKRTRQQLSRATVVSLEEFRDVTAVDHDEAHPYSPGNSELDECTDDEDDEYDDHQEEEDTPASIEEQLNNISTGAERRYGLPAHHPIMDSAINIALLPVNDPSNNLITAAAPNAVTLSSLVRTEPLVSIPVSFSPTQGSLRPILTAPFDANPYTTTVTVAEWQEFLSRPSTVQIWRRKAILGDPSGTSNDNNTEILSSKTAGIRRKKYEWTQVYVCAHAGAPRDRRDPNKRRRKTNKKSIKCGCKARITAGKVIDSDSVVVRWSWEHNGHEHAYPAPQDVKLLVKGDTTGRINNMQEIGKEVQSLVEDIRDLENMRSEVIGDDFQKLLQWRDVLACTLSKGAEIFGS